MTTISDSTLYLSNDDLYLLGAGEWYRSYEKLGSHPDGSPRILALRGRGYYYSH